MYRWSGVSGAEFLVNRIYKINVHRMDLTDPNASPALLFVLAYRLEIPYK